MNPVDEETAFYAHSRDGLGKKDWQRLKDHLINTAGLAYKFGREAGVADLAYIAGLMHDIGKYSRAFQRRLEGARLRVDHSTAGAQELIQIYNKAPQEKLAEILAYCIAGHHAGLPDMGSPLDMGEEGTLKARIKAKTEDFSAYRAEIDPNATRLPEKLKIKPLPNHLNFSFSFMTRMVYSALVDADFQETENFMRGDRKRGNYESMAELCTKFNAFLQKFNNPMGEINRKRNETLNSCVAHAALEQGFFTLTVPTGGGKTLASMAFALNHAVKHNLQRVIYVIPFTSIIEQNAAVFKGCLGEENVLEHHCNFDWEQKHDQSVTGMENQTNSAIAKLKLAAENWDIPIVVTTNVQFFESLFASRSSRCRKLHNLAKSVIIFDEAQMLPVGYLQPAMNAVWELVTNYGASTVFCTATQPALQNFLPETAKFTELANQPKELFNFYKRVKVVYKGILSDPDLTIELNESEQALCIVNTRKHAKGLFDGLEGEGRFHLSTLMCPAHRKENLVEIRDRLVNKLPCRVVSTQVMEAGIDVDFPIGFRAMAGLDSIIQAAGRVNREGKQQSSWVYAFEPKSDFVKRTPTFIAQAAAVARDILTEYRNDPICIEAIQAYYQKLYPLHDRQAFDKNHILDCFNKADGFDFRKAAERFNIIENNTQTIIIPYNENAKVLIEELKFTDFPNATLRKLQPYMVNIYEQEFEKINNQGHIYMAIDTYPVLNSMDWYHPETGLIIPDSAGGDALFY